MLALSLRVGQSIVIGSPPRAVRVTLRGVNGRADFHVDAPRDVPVDREAIARLRQHGRLHTLPERNGTV